jgi:hypothetical protein
VCQQAISITDIMATCAAITGATLPNNSAEDSFNMLPALLGQADQTPIRPYLLSQTISLALAIRQGPWKYLDHQGSGGNRYDRGELMRYALPEQAPNAPGQLYHLELDPGETNNLYEQNPEMVSALKALLEESKAHGRSRAETR